MGWLKKLIPTHSLFGRIFLWFWLATIILMSGSTFIIRQVINTAELKPVEAEVLFNSQRTARNIAEQLNARPGAKGDIGHAFVRFSRSKGMPMILVNLEDDMVYSALPPPMRPSEPVLQSMLNETEPQLMQTIRADFIGPHEVIIDQQRHALFLGDPKPFSFLFSVNQRMPLNVPIIMFITSGIFCFLFVWTLVRPIRRLQAATQKMAAGELDTTLPAESLGQDELGELGRDFNRMSEQIRHQVETQRRLLADISHELRSPLARQQVAVGLARKLAAREDLAGVQRAIDRMDQENQRLNEMIGQILQLSRLEGLPQVEFQSVDLSAMLEEIILDASFEAESQNKRVIFLHQNYAVMAGNSDLLSSAIENVLRNAIHYAQRSIQVVLLTVNQVNRITITDDGPGVNEALLAALFTPFYRLSEARDRDSGGVGLGLAIAKQAVSLHGGHITATNVTGGGLRVCIELPIARQTPSESDKSTDKTQQLKCQLQPD